MADLEAQDLVQQAVLLGLMRQEQATEALNEAEDGSTEAISRTMLRKGMLTSWQLDRLKKGDTGGFFFGDCKVLFHLAEGTFARVYRGMRVYGDQPVAIKVLRQRFFSDPGAIDRFKKEAENGMKLIHSNIVRILDYGERDRRCFMIMEYVEGSNLREFLRIRQRFSAKAALPLMIGLAEGLKYSHERGVTHRDIKATNILISSSGVAKLVDFGLATIESEEKKESSVVNVRTVDYSALERTCGSPKGDPRSDVFFLGCVYYQMLTGQAPMPETESKDMLTKMLKRSLGAIKPISEHHHAPDAELCRIIEKMMKIELKARYQTVDEVIADLQVYVEREAEGGSGRRHPSLTTISPSMRWSTARSSSAPARTGPPRPRRPVPLPRRSSASRNRAISRMPSARHSRRWATASSSSPIPNSRPSAIASPSPTPLSLTWTDWTRMRSTPSWRCTTRHTTTSTTWRPSSCWARNSAPSRRSSPTMTA